MTSWLLFLSVLHVAGQAETIASMHHKDDIVSALHAALTNQATIARIHASTPPEVFGQTMAVRLRGLLSLTYLDG